MTGKPTSIVSIMERDIKYPEPGKHSYESKYNRPTLVEGNNTPDCSKYPETRKMLETFYSKI